MKKVILIILDGWGEGKDNFLNPIHIAKKEFLDYIREHFPFFLLQASGIAVGLPWHEEGNSEVGHLTIGTGKVFYQNYPKIMLAIQNETFFENTTLKKLIDHALKFNSRIHLIGLLTEGIIHASFDHLVALLEFFRRNNFNKVFLHLFLDGRDSPPKSGLYLLEKLENIIREKRVGIIATLCGRTYGMDKNEYWLVKTQIAYKLITQGIGKKVENYKDYLLKLYKEKSDFNDENLEPILVNEDGILKDGDVVFFFNIREDGIIQLARAFLDLEFSYFPVVKKNNVLVASIVRYIENLDYLVAFEKDKIKTSLSKILAENNLKQLKIAEKVKSYHLTFYFNGFISEPHPNEFWKILPSQDVSIKENPLMRSYEITNLVINALKEKIYDFIAINYAAPDIIAHTGDINLAKLVVEEIDKLLKKIYNMLDENWFLIITSDHGNIEEMVRIDTGEISTSHDFNPVPCYIVNKDFYIENKSNDLKVKEKKIVGSLIDIAPTILELMELNIPKEMEGKNLLKYYF